jgi:hypothetical protein
MWKDGMWPNEELLWEWQQQEEVGREGSERGCKREEDTHLLITYQARATSRMQPMLNSQAGSMQSKHKPANLK